MAEDKFTDEYFKENLSDQEYNVLREKGTERAFTGEYDEFFDEGMYKCKACGAQLFDSGHKYNSGCGWPAFDEAIPGAVEFTPDNSLGMHRTEVTCAKCGSHLGHIFDDGPKETTGKRFCINSIALDFDKEKNKK
jgi:peptide-methionine (R)-S-oxide reductase